MNINVGKVDRWIRIVVGAAILMLTFVGPRSWIGLLGLVPLITGVLASCPVYGVLGLSTDPRHA